MNLIPLKRVNNWRVHGYQYDEKLLTVAIIHKKYMSYIPAFTFIETKISCCYSSSAAQLHQ